MKTIGIAGGGGFVGSNLARLLVEKGYNVVIFTRGGSGTAPGITYARWNPEKKECDLAVLPGLNAMVNLSGAGIADKKWTPRRKKEITDSRVQSAEFLTELLNKHSTTCHTLVAASAIGFYGSDSNAGHPFSESDLPAGDFLGETCRLWEQASQKNAGSRRTVILRIGIVLGNGRGAFPAFYGPLSFGMRPILGSGKQIISWIAVSDLAQMIIFAIGHPDISGIYNAVAPAPVSNKELMTTLSRLNNHPSIPFHVPAFVLRLLLGEMSDEALKSCTASSKKIIEAGFVFEHKNLESAIRSLLDKK